MDGEGNAVPNRSVQLAARTRERRIAALAGRQHGVVGYAQLVGIGLSRHQIDLRVRSGRLHRLHRGVYAVGHDRVDARGRWMAATLTVPDSVLSHASAAALWGLRSTASGFHHLTASRRATRPELIAHRRRLPAGERTDNDGIPVTTVARTLLDIAATEGAGCLERALREATFLGLTDPLGLPALLERYPGARGTAIAAGVLADGAYEKRTRSELENRFLDFLRERRLPLPETNATIEVGGQRFEVDCLWRRRALVVELDGYASHLSRGRAEADRERDGWLGARGLVVSRVTWRRLERDPGGLESQLRMALT
jgi:very-short-patch-repair endonuclease